MSDTALTTVQIREVDARIENGVRRYFDHYLENVFPQQQKALREHTHLMIKQHEDSDSAHGGVERKFTRLIWLLAGVGTASGGLGVGLTRLFGGL